MNSRAATLQLQKLNAQNDDFIKKTVVEKARSLELDRKCDEARELITQKRRANKDHGGAFASREVTKKTSKAILLLESEKARILLASNKIDQSMRDIRQQINERRMHRIAHDRVFGELKLELHNCKLELAAALERSNEVMEVKDQLDKQKESKMSEFEEEVLSFEGQFQEISMETQVLQEKYRAQFEKGARRSDAGADVDTLTERAIEESAQRAKLRVAQLDEWINEAHEYIEQCDKRIKKLGDVFQMMMMKQGVQTLDHLVRVFREAESKKFKTFTYTQHVNREVKFEEKLLEDVQRQMEDFKIANGAESEEKKQRLRQLSAEAHRTVASIAYYDELTSKDMDTIKEILNIARRVANSVDSSTAAFEPDASAAREDALDLSTITDFITEADMTGCMGVVEGRAQHAIKLFSDALKTPAGKAAASAHLAQSRRDATLRAVSSPSPGMRGGASAGSSFGFESTAAPSLDVSAILSQVEKGPSVPKTLSPMFHVPHYPGLSKHVSVEEDDLLSDERPMRRAELLDLARGDVDGSDLSAQDSLRRASYTRAKKARAKKH